MTAELPEDLISLLKAASLLSVTPNCVRRWIIGRRLKGYRTGRRWKISREDLLAFVNKETEKELARCEKTLGDGGTQKGVPTKTARQQAREDKITDEYMRKHGMR